jgi:hypothetical protein
MKHIAPWVDTFLLVCTTSAYHALYMNDIYNDLLEIKEDLLKITKPKSCVKMRTTFVHWPQVLDIVNLDDKIKNKIRKNTVKNEFTEEFLKRLDGKRTSDKSFKDLVKLQDKLYNRTPADLPDLWEYVYET